MEFLAYRYLEGVERAPFHERLFKLASCLIHPIETYEREFSSGESSERRTYSGSKFPLSAFDKDRLSRIRKKFQTPNLQFSDCFDTTDPRLIFHKLVSYRRDENPNTSTAMHCFNYVFYFAFHPITALKELKDVILEEDDEYYMI